MLPVMPPERRLVDLDDALKMLLTSLVQACAPLDLAIIECKGPGIHDPRGYMIICHAWHAPRACVTCTAVQVS